MTGPLRGARWLALALPLLSWIAPGCQSGGDRPASTGAGGLLDGPTRWLMLPDEMRQAEHLQTNREAIDFVEAFWRRRDPDPREPGNELAKAFYERVDAADHLYSEGGVRGSMTDRGRALILLGPPPVLRYNRRRLPAWEPGKLGARPAIQTRTAMVEVWAYLVTDLPPELAKAVLDEEPEAGQIELAFLEERNTTRLIEGEKFLEIAARAAVRDLTP